MHLYVVIPEPWSKADRYPESSRMVRLRRQKTKPPSARLLRRIPGSIPLRFMAPE
jgi:hypothetical protein